MSDDLKRIVGLRVRGERLARGITQEQLSERIDRTVETVSNLERGKAWPGIDTLLQICDVFQIKISQIFEDDDSLHPTSKRVELQAYMRVLLGKLADNDLEIAVRQVEVLVDRRQVGPEVNRGKRLLSRSNKS
ncbi:helix-turn-helix transcriptional regulator [Azospirillum sp. B2RO_4]|uniref:helix-turn-helix transcriptional regulator n=1 Tax=Azospirillum sp. B2RO_4 TaxID=3027796 RepID=UPI003DA87E1F